MYNDNKPTACCSTDRLAVFLQVFCIVTTSHVTHIVLPVCGRLVLSRPSAYRGVMPCILCGRISGGHQHRYEAQEGGGGGGGARRGGGGRSTGGGASSGGLSPLRKRAGGGGGGGGGGGRGAGGLGGGGRSNSGGQTSSAVLHHSSAVLHHSRNSLSTARASLTATVVSHNALSSCPCLNYAAKSDAAYTRYCNELLCGGVQLAQCQATHMPRTGPFRSGAHSIVSHCSFLLMT